MPDSRVVVLNTTPLIALSIATGSVEVLRMLYERVIVPHEVQQEILAGCNQSRFRQCTPSEEKKAAVTV